MNTYTKSGYDGEAIDTYNQKTLAQRRCMQDENDWKNAEIMGYVKLNSYDSMGYFSWYARSGWHTHGTAPNGENKNAKAQESKAKSILQWRHRFGQGAMA
jgi:hypothetical protein